MSDELMIVAGPPTSVYELRQLVLRPGQPPETCVFEGDDDPETVHFAAIRDSKPIGVASIYHKPSPKCPRADAWQLRGMATHPTARGTGVGADLLAACISHAQARSAELLWCNARITAEGFYARFGFDRLGENYEIPGIGTHCYMHRAVAE